MEKENQLTHLVNRLASRRRELSAMPAEQALDRILSFDQPVALVHSMPAQDLHLLIHDIGLNNALPLLKLASNRQWEYILDVEGWHRDRIDLDAVTRWTQLLMAADSLRMARWAGNEKVEFFEYFLFKNIRVAVREHDKDPADFGDDFFTLDGIFYIRILDHPADIEGKEDPTRKQFAKTRRRLISDLVKHLADEDPIRFHQILIEAMHIIPAETEEEAFRRRNVRMAEKGFLPFDEAVGIYQPLMMADLKQQIARPEFRPAIDKQQPVARFAGRLGSKHNPVIQALEVFDVEAHRLQVEMELASLANRLIAADQKTIREREDLKTAVGKACGYARIGLSVLAKESGIADPDPQTFAALMAKYSLLNLFKLGFGYALRLKWRADSWHKRSWFYKNGLGLTFWGENWMGVLGGLLIKKPRYYDEAGEEERYREFTRMADIIATETILNEILAMDAFLSRIEIDVQARDNLFLTYKNVLLTLWVRACLCLSPGIAPIQLSLFRPFYKDRLFEPHKNGLPDVRTAVRLSAKQSFLDWLVDQSGLRAEKIQTQIGVILDALFAEIEREMGHVSPKDLDPRFVTLFLLR